MTPKTKKRILENCENCGVVIVRYEDEIFGKSLYTLKNYKIENKSDKAICLDGLQLEYDNIVRIYIDTDLEKRIELIGNAKSIEEGLWYASSQMAYEEEQALEKLQQKLFPKQVERYLQWLRNEIMPLNHSNLSVESILSNLLLNILGKEKIENTSELKCLRQITQNDIEKVIKGMEEIF